MKYLFALLFCVPNLTIGQIMTQQGYVYNHSKDTIHFVDMAADFRGLRFCDPIRIVDSIQIDGQGKKEIVFYRFCRLFTNEHGGSFDISEYKEIGKYEIWDLDTKALLFEAVNHLASEFDRFRAGQGSSKGSELYNYELAIDSLGTVTIRYADADSDPKNKKESDKTKKGSSGNAPAKAKPDKQEGIYRFSNGKYRKD